MHAYREATGTLPTVRTHAPWLRSMRGERPEYERDREHQRSRADHRRDGDPRRRRVRGLVLLLLGLSHRALTGLSSRCAPVAQLDRAAAF